MSPRCNQQNINTGPWSIWPYMPQSLALYWKSLVLLQLATPKKRLPESSNLRLGSIPLPALFPALVPSLRLQWLLFALTGHLLSNSHEDSPLCREFWSLEWHWEMMGTLLSCWMRGNSRHLCSLAIPVIPTTIPLGWVFPRAHKQLSFRIRTLTSETDIPPSEFGLSLGSIYALSTWNVFKDSGLTIFMKLISKFIPFWSRSPHHSYE